MLDESVRNLRRLVGLNTSSNKMVHSTSCNFILLVCIFTFADGLSSDGSYQQTLLFPPINGEIQGLTQFGNQPAVQTTAGFRLNPPPALRNLPFIPHPSRSMFSGVLPQNTPFRRLLPRLLPSGANLFLPNTIKQPVESRAQFEEYKKYLKETAEEDEKERNLNIVGIDDKKSFETTSEDGSPTTNSFVKLHVQGKDYSYSTQI